MCIVYTPHWGPSPILRQPHILARTSSNIFTFHAINPMTKPIFHTTHAWLYHHPAKSEPSPGVFLKNNKWISIVYTMCINIYIYMYMSNHQTKYCTTSRGFTTLSLFGGFLNHQDTAKSSKSVDWRLGEPKCV